MRITRIEPRSLLIFGLVLAGTMVVLDLVVILALWTALSVMGMPSALGISVGLPTVIAIAILIGAVHGIATAVLVGLVGAALNLSSTWTGGLMVDINDDLLVLPDTRAARFNGRESVEGVSLHRD